MSVVRSRKHVELFYIMGCSTADSARRLKPVVFTNANCLCLLSTERKNGMMSRIFRPERDEVTGRWRKLHNGELHNLHSSLDIIRVMKSRRTGLAGHVARMGKIRNACS
jgi:hypothetical protein